MFWTASRTFLSSMALHARRARYPTLCSYLSDADSCLYSNVVPDSCLQTHGKDYAKISAAVQEKCREDCSVYYRDWHKRHPPMISFMQSFDPLVHPTRKVQRNAAPVKAPIPSTPHAELNQRLSSAERAGLAHHNAMSTAWNLSQLTEFYVALKVRQLRPCFGPHFERFLPLWHFTRAVRGTLRCARSLVVRR